MLTIQTYPALYSLLGVQYGGDGKNTFGLPDLRGRAASTEPSSDFQWHFYTRNRICASHLSAAAASYGANTPNQSGRW
ncbi:phage tail protein [Pseudomonas sp. S 311-6]|nr:phage tail protein [Pseudomonas mosselii]MCO7597252.1 phage tail protein [Pseudomonas guariconensis]MCO7615911.1 phage tail protein [Pseudomonas guariconensis]MCO7638788.1 phage tail protein [Pseudomonas sp. S 311-6]